MYNVSVSPHVREQSTTQSIMRDVIIALLPILAFGVYHFGIGALQVIIISVVTCVIGEILFDLAVKKPVTVFDGSAVVTGLILAINLPATAIWWMPVLGGLFAIVAVKMLFGAELYESCVGSKMFSVNFIFRKNDRFYYGWCFLCNSACSNEGRRTA